MTSTFHIHATKDWVKQQVRAHGPSVLGRPKMNKADALRFIDECPTEFVPVGDDCNNRDELGKCKGHPAEDDT